MTATIHPRTDAPRAWLMWSLGVPLFFFTTFQRVAASAVAKDLMRSFAAPILAILVRETH